VQVYSQILSQREDLEARVVSLFEHLLPGIAVPAVLARLRISTERALELGARSDALKAEQELEGNAVAAAG